MSLHKIRFILDYFENEYGMEGWGTNLQPEKTALDWLHYRFTPQEVWRYLEARCPIPSKAAQCKRVSKRSVVLLFQVNLNID